MTFPVSITRCTPGIYTSRFQGGEGSDSIKPNLNDPHVQGLTQLLAQLKTATIQKGPRPHQVRINGVLYGVLAECLPNNRMNIAFLEESVYGAPLLPGRSLHIWPKAYGLREDTVYSRQGEGNELLSAGNPDLCEQYMAWARDLITEQQLQVRIIPARFPTCK